MGDILPNLCQGGVRHDELLALLFEQYPSMVGVNDETVELQGRDNSTKLFVSQIGDVISRVETGPSITDEEVSSLRRRIEDDLLVPPTSAVQSNVLMAGLPVVGWYRWRDRVQLRPVPSDSPQADHLWAPHPFVAEVRGPSSPALYLAQTRQAKTMSEMKWLLSVFLPSVHAPTRGAKVWVVGPPNDGPRVALQQRGYHAAFPQPFETLSAETRMETLAAGPFYTMAALGVGIGRSVMCVPDNLDGLFKAAESLSGEDRRAFLNACCWYAAAHPESTHSISLSYLALMTAIEALCPDPPRDAPRCRECGKSSGPGPTKLFKDLLEEYVPAANGSSPEERSAMKRLRDRLYGVRSSLTHGGYLLSGDVPEGPSPRSMSHWQLLQQAAGIVRIALVNWLCKRAPAEPDDACGPDAP